MAIPDGFVRSAAVYSTGALVVVATVAGAVSCLWGLGTVVLWWVPSMAEIVIAQGDPAPPAVLVRMLVGMVAIAPLGLACLAKVGWIIAGELGEITLRTLGVTRGDGEP
jgi:hypothetical protein